MKYVIFHLHFYQPPRMNPFVNEIEFQSSAYPYDNWNERIARECYIPNVYARIFDPSGYILNIINNLDYVSFNFGPTLINWIKRYCHDLYCKIIEADRNSINRLGCGNAIAQVYNHVIMPLVNRIDKENQVYWAIQDFRYHFGRDPVGMWLSETAVDVETLEVLALHGIRFTILAPHQIKAFRRIGDSEWIENNGNLPNKPFLINLPSGRKIIVFVYNSMISHAVSFQDLLSSGERLSKTILGEFKDDNDVIVIASDGETYGHHKKFGELGLAYCIYTLLSNPSTKVCNFEYYIKNVDILYEAMINENTSWSCFHGIGRWKENCGCKFDMNTSQEWRRNLKIAVDGIRNVFEEIYANTINEIGISDLRREYINYIIKRDNHIDSVDDLQKIICDFMNDNGIDDCQNAKKLMNLLEIYKNILFAYTSCGWFFDDISGLEATQNLKFLYWAVTKLKEFFGVNLEPILETILKDAKSNYYYDGYAVFKDFVKISCLGKDRILASYIFSKMFFETPSRFLNCFWQIEDLQKYSGENVIISTGRAKCTDISDFSFYSSNFVFVYLGGLSFYFGIGEFEPSEVFDTVKNYSQNGDYPEIINFINRCCFKVFSLNDVFVNSRRNIIRKLISSNVEQIDKKIDEIFFEQKNIIRNLIDADFYPIPLEMRLITLLILDNQIDRAIENYDPRQNYYEDIMYFVTNRDKLDLSLDQEKIKNKFETRLKDMLITLKSYIEEKNIKAIECLDNIHSFIDFGMRLRISYNLWESQNIMFSLYRYFIHNKQVFIEKYGKDYQEIERKIISLADILRIRLIT